jgi:exodeoxyribonuclease-3
MQIISWNVNGIRAAERKGFLDWLQAAQPDIVGLQETKAQPEQLSAALRSPEGYHSFWASGERKGYSGVALYSRVPPREVRYGLGIDAFDREGRTLIADFDDFVFITTYIPNGGNDHARVPFKMGYKAALLGTCERLRGQGRSVILCGDINTAHHEIDLARPRENRNTTGFLPVERTWLDALVSLGWIDTFRHVHGEVTGAYSWWTVRVDARERNVGWRLDYHFASPDLAARIAGAAIHTDVLGSDHCPVSVTLINRPEETRTDAAAGGATPSCR